MDGKFTARNAKISGEEVILDHKMTAVMDDVTTLKKYITALKDEARSTVSRTMSKLDEMGRGRPRKVHFRWLVSLCLGVSS